VGGVAEEHDVAAAPSGRQGQLVGVVHEHVVLGVVDEGPVWRVVVEDGGDLLAPLTGLAVAGPAGFKGVAGDAGVPVVPWSGEAM
jgi:hypothetical protein